MVVETDLIHIEHSYHSHDDWYFLTQENADTITSAIESGEKVLIHMLDPDMHVFGEVKEMYTPIRVYTPGNEAEHIAPYFDIAVLPSMYASVYVNYESGNKLKINEQRIE